MIGNTLSHYKIIEKLGQGGMGEVYLAEDSRLDRKVALKILPQHLSERAELRERFEREARAVSSLNHPHICTLYDVGEADGIHYLVMEHLVGETLEARLAKGALPLEQTLEYAIQIADALDKAHRQGVVHRDLKPGNIMLVKSGAKLLDFGLAKLQAADTPTNLSALPTEQANLTAEGTILGTLQYMAPEQLEAKEADSRTDIFAFGAVVYEMATGKKAFEGNSQASLIAAILKDDPPAMAELQPMTPSVFDRIVKRCLAKDPDKRWQTATDLMEELKWVTETGTPSDSLPGFTGLAAWKKAIPWAITAMVVVVAGLSIWTQESPLSSLPTRLVINTTAAPVMDTDSIDLSISSDGKRIVYPADLGGRRQLYVRSLDSFEAMPIPGTEGVDAGSSIFSADGEWVAFFSDGKMKKVSLSGGPSITLCNASPPARGGSWSSEDQIVFAAASSAGSVGLYSVSAAGGEPQILAVPDSSEDNLEYSYPEILPGGKTLLFTIRKGFGDFQIAALSLETGVQTLLVEEGRQANYAPTGHLVYELPGTGTLMAAPFDPERLEVTGEAYPVLEGLRYSNPIAVDYMFSDDGTLVYLPAGGRDQRSLVWVDRQGKSQPVTDIRRFYNDPSFSPDGKHLALTVEQEGGDDVWTYDVERGTLTPLTFDGSSRSPTWTPDGKRLAFHTHRIREDIFWVAVDGTSEAEQLTTSEAVQIPISWSPDGALSYTEGPVIQRDIWVLPSQTGSKPNPFMVTEFDERHPMFSPDGEWIAFTSDQSGRNEIYVKRYAGEGRMILVSTGGGREPVWSPDGKELFYRSGNKLMVVSVQTSPIFSAGRPEMLFEGNYAYAVPDFTSNYDISPGGQRFLMIEEVEGSTAQINVIQNWFTELNRLVPIDN